MSSKHKSRRLPPHLKQHIYDAMAVAPLFNEKWNAMKINVALPPPETSREELLNRLRTFPYPYQSPIRAKRGTTFYSHVEKLDLLDFLVNTAEGGFLWTVRLAWYFQLDHELRKEQTAKNISEYGYPLGFHRDLMCDISIHLDRIALCAKNSKVPGTWLKEYREALLKELLRNALVWFPELTRWFKPVNRLLPRADEPGRQMMVLQELHREFRNRKLENEELPYELTALICSPAKCVLTKVLSPTPAGVRSNDKKRNKKLQDEYKQNQH